MTRTLVHSKDSNNAMKNKYLAMNCSPRFKDSANGKKVFECESQWEATQLARMHWCVKPRDFNMLAVYLIEKDGKTVVHHADF